MSYTKSKDVLRLELQLAALRRDVRQVELNLLTAEHADWVAQAHKFNLSDHATSTKFMYDASVNPDGGSAHLLKHLFREHFPSGVLQLLPGWVTYQVGSKMEQFFNVQVSLSVMNENVDAGAVDVQRFFDMAPSALRGIVYVQFEGLPQESAATSLQSVLARLPQVA